MPSWSQSSSLPYIGVKIVTSFPQNSSRNLPGIHASYLLFDSVTGKTLSIMDGTELTLWRTSCVSALASKFLSRKDVEVLVMIGAGSLAPYLIRAHLFVRPSLKKVIIWNRRSEKARDLVKKLQEEGMGGVNFEHGECLEEIVKLGDIISCATSSENPIVKGDDLKMGSHLDLVGSFTPLMRECDDEAIKRGKVFIDCEAAMVEAGELVGAFERGVVSPGEIGGTLVDLIKGEKIGRSGFEEITVFKSVGSAVVDIVGAQLVYETYLQKNNL
ncbi:Ornithine cyclodeaminase/mu-crystallin [Macleaya cordata]|uniref:Ornithine cyclodeaminase/mu-crystallin n=1 Tax=Macleaya cordata TaxID=56857 RepID=A0A200R2K6_MACCD|nr:Ornithine cyclodeaminase/mu-crystallin [Macleaya cordata]